MPFLLEASGSPNSYHIWIFLAKTKTYNAFRFVRQIQAEANVKCEVWPKQKTILDKDGNVNKDRKYGNLVKIPICIHHKTGARSGFLDDNFEPLEFVDHPGLIHLLEIPELTDNGSVAMPIIKFKKPGYSSESLDTELDYCMQRVLRDHVPLEGSEGHHLRLAIAVKARQTGLDAEATTQLFQQQEDYDHDYSLKKILETWSYGYTPFSCATLRDKCGIFVKPYCPTSPFNSFQLEANKIEGE